jgi:hypothetical protein
MFDCGWHDQEAELVYPYANRKVETASDISDGINSKVAESAHCSVALQCVDVDEIAPLL